jgi:hypothetical protein
MNDNVYAEIAAHTELGNGAMDLLQRHFAAINAGDREAFRETAYLFDANDGLPFERWWSGMHSLAPLTMTLTLCDVGSSIRDTREPHVAIWIQVVAHSAITAKTYSSKFVVWYLVRSRNWKLGCRIHWWLAEP